MTGSTSRSRCLSFLSQPDLLQPEDDDIKAHWDKLVVSAKSFPCLYWDKFIKKRVSETMCLI